MTGTATTAGHGTSAGTPAALPTMYPAGTSRRRNKAATRSIAARGRVRRKAEGPTPSSTLTTPAPPASVVVEQVDPIVSGPMTVAGAAVQHAPPHDERERGEEDRISEHM